MANSQTGPLIYIDTTGSVRDSKTLVSYIFFTPDAAEDQMILRSTASGPDVLVLRSATEKDTVVYDCSRKPLVFINGIYVQTLSSGAKATIVTTEAGK